MNPQLQTLIKRTVGLMVLLRHRRVEGRGNRDDAYQVDYLLGVSYDVAYHIESTSLDLPPQCIMYIQNNQMDKDEIQKENTRLQRSIAI